MKFLISTSSCIQCYVFILEKKLFYSRWYKCYYLVLFWFIESILLFKYSSCIKLSSLHSLINTKYTTNLHLLAPRLRLKSWQLLYDQLCCWWWKHRGNRSGQPSGIPFFQSAWFMESFLIRNLFFENSINQHLHMFIILFLFKRVNLRKISFGTVKNF